MAKRRTIKRKVVRARSPIARKKVGKRRSKSKNSMNELKLYGYGVAYGATRETVNNLIKQGTSKLGIRAIDEFALPIAMYFVAKGKVPMMKSPMIKQYAKTGLIAEGTVLGASRIAPIINNMFIKGKTSVSVNTTIR